MNNGHMPSMTMASNAAPLLSGTTYQLSLTPSGSAKNVYTVYGDTTSAISLPVVYQSDAPFGANTGGVAAGFIAAVPTTAFDSWLTVGPTDGSGAGISSIGIDWDGWIASAGMSVDNGAVFWMSPDNGPSDSAVVAQVTVAGDFTATLSAQGCSTSGNDWQASGIKFSRSGDSGGGGGGGGSGYGGDASGVDIDFYFGSEIPATAGPRAMLDDGTGFATGRDGYDYG
jgi:hypothetical protein